jgi:hypothetical protein
MVRTAFAVVLLVSGFLLAWPFGTELTDMDRCSEAGGSFDYASGRCDFKVNHPSAELWQRHGKGLLASIALGALGCALLFRRKRPEEPPALHPSES